MQLPPMFPVNGRFLPETTVKWFICRQVFSGPY